jgi:hypothetical protein
MAVRNIVGNVPEPNELYGRADLIGHLWRQIQGNNILLLAPRRFGKTGVMRHVLLKPQAGYLPLYFDLEDVDRPEEFVWRVTQGLLSNDTARRFLAGVKSVPNAIRDWVRDTFDEVGFEGGKVKFKEAVAADWRSVARKLILEMEKADDTLIFIFDELPSMLDMLMTTCGDRAAADFVSWFRSIRMQQKDQLRRHRFIVGGSTGIDLILRRLSTSDKLNDFERVYVEPIGGPEIQRLLRGLAESMEVEADDAVLSCMLDLIGPPVPYFIHLLFSQLGQLPADRRRPLTVATLHETYQRRLLEPTCKHYFDHYCVRLKRYGPARQRAAMAILAAVAQQQRVSDSVLRGIYRKARKRGASNADFDQLMGDLECDWYLALDPHTNEYFFMVNVIGDWWRRWFRSPRK